MFLELSLSSTTPRGRTVCTHKNLECLEKQQKWYFPGNSLSMVALETGWLLMHMQKKKKNRIGLLSHAIEKNQFQTVLGRKSQKTTF